MTASSLARETGTSWEELKPQLARLTAGGQTNLVFASHSTNPHIKRLPDLPVDEQLRRLETEPPSGIGSYPEEAVLKPLVEERARTGGPYTARLAFGAPQLVPLFFELKVLATYFSDPRYHCKFWDSSGLISVSNEHYQSEAMPEKDKAATFRECRQGVFQRRHRTRGSDRGARRERRAAASRLHHAARTVAAEVLPNR